MSSTRHTRTTTLTARQAGWLRRAWRHGGWPCALYWLCALCWLSLLGTSHADDPAALRASTLLVPGGRLSWSAYLEQAQARDAITADGNTRPLIDFYYPERKAEELTGDVSTLTRSAFGVMSHYGLLDHWNLVVQLDWHSSALQQSLKISEDSAGELEQEVQLFDDHPEVSGLGDVHVLSLHRLSNQDELTVLLGYGFRFPLSSPQTPYLGARDPNPASPTAGVTSVFRLNLYPLGTRWLIHSALVLDQGFTGEVDTLTQGQKRLQPGSLLVFNNGWQRVGLRWRWGASLNYLERRADRIDIVTDTGPGTEKVPLDRGFDVGLHLGYGNLGRLETAHTAWPYELAMQVQFPLRRNNAPQETSLTLSATLF